MNDRKPLCFVDTNIFVYSFDDLSKHKQEKAIELIARLTASSTMMISTQVIRELINVFFKRSQLEAASPLFEYVRMVLVPCVGDIDELALAKSGALTALENGVSYYDALILEAATMTNCSILYSEDFQHGRTYGSVQVINPFA